MNWGLSKKIIKTAYGRFGKLHMTLDCGHIAIGDKRVRNRYDRTGYAICSECGSKESKAKVTV